MKNVWVYFRSGMAAIALWALASSTANAQLLGLGGCGISNLTIVGNTARGGINLPGIIGTEFVLEFESVKNLNASSLGLCARLAGPIELLSLLIRLPDGSLQVALPIVISVNPPSSKGLSFTNTYRAEIHTHLLGYTLNSPFRLYKAPHAGAFYDMTNEVAAGSVRTRGRTGGFSDFLIVLDLIPASNHALRKYDYLAARIENPAIPPAVRTALRADLAASRSAFNARNYSLALSKLDAFISRVRVNAGVAIPNFWRAQRDTDNIAGDLIGYGESLRFSINRARGI